MELLPEEDWHREEEARDRLLIGSSSSNIRGAELFIKMYALASAGMVTLYEP